MKKTLNYEKAFSLLSDAAVEFGCDRTVRDPVDFIRRNLNVSKFAAWSYLKELERRGLVAFNYEGVCISSVRLIKHELPKHFYESDDITRVLAALWKHRHISLSDPKKQIVHTSFLSNVQGDADVLCSRLYVALQKFSENGWIEIIYSGVTKNPRIVYVVIKDEFPKHLVSEFA